MTIRSSADHGGAGRRSRGRPRLPLDRIVATALTILDQDGADALSMRTLAQRLDSGTATLYRHFPSRADLVAQVIDLIFGEMESAGPVVRECGWREACLRLAHDAFDVLTRHANVSPLLVSGVPIGPNALRHREHHLAILLDAGFPPPLAAKSYATLMRFVLGFAMQVNGRGNTVRLDDEAASAVFRDLDPASFPATLAVADALPVALREEFAFGLELITNGLAARLLEPDTDT